MTPAAAGYRRDAVLDALPIGLLEVSIDDGVVRVSNRRVERTLGTALVGRRLADLLDPPSRRKWLRTLDEAPAAAPGWLRAAAPLELVFRGRRGPMIRSFRIARSEERPGSLWLVEHARDPRLERLYGELASLNTELVDAQRTLSRERARLARALDAAEAARARAEAAVRARDEVLAVVSHDLRNPLNTISLSAQFMLETPLEKPQRRGQLEAMRRAAGRMDGLIRDLLDVAAIEAGRLSIEPRPVDPADLLRETCEAFLRPALEKRQRLECRPQPGAPAVLADRDRVLQALSNLVGNAVKFTPEGGRITVRAGTTDDAVRFTVSDTGPGIPPEDLPHIFDRFWQARRTGQAGAGLGLAIVKGIAEAHGGHIDVESEVGRGTTFSFALPAVRASPAERASSL